MIAAKRDIRERFWSKVDRTQSCWLWTGGKNDHGYGQIGVGSQRDGTRGMGYAHRLSYEWANGPIPRGLQIDHLCHTRGCVRPDHLEAVDRKTNLLRSSGITAVNARKTHCPRAHPYDLFNTHIRPDGGRVCRTCTGERSAKRRKPICSIAV